MLPTFFILLFSFSSVFGSSAGQNCSVITAKHADETRKPIELERCAIGVGGATYDLEAAPIQHYWFNGKLFSGAIQETTEGYVYRTEKDIKNTPVKRSKDFPSTFSCTGKNKNNMQCMVCNCFFEVRGQNFDEQVMVHRTVLSRVISPAHPNNVCGVVHQKSQFSWTIDMKKYRVRSKKRNQYLVLGEKSKDLRSIDKKSFRACAASAQEAVKYDNEFFASYYVSKKIKMPPWLKKCQYRSRKKIIKITNKDNRIRRKDLAHNFYRVCERKENICLKSASCKRDES